MVDDKLPNDFEDQIRKAWAKASKDEQESALIQASADIESHFQFRGTRQKPTQSMEWPRRGAHYDDGTPIKGVPDEVKKACFFYVGCVVAGYNWQHVGILARLALILRPVTDSENPLKNTHRLH